MADKPDLGSGAARRESSSLLESTFHNYKSIKMNKFINRLINLTYYLGFPWITTYIVYGSEHTFLPSVYGVLLCSLMDKLDAIENKIK